MSTPHTTTNDPRHYPIEPTTEEDWNELRRSLPSLSFGDRAPVCISGQDWSAIAAAVLKHLHHVVPVYLHNGELVSMRRHILGYFAIERVTVRNLPSIVFRVVELYHHRRPLYAPRDAKYPYPCFTVPMPLRRALLADPAAWDAPRLGWDGISHVAAAKRMEAISVWLHDLAGDHVWLHLAKDESTLLYRADPCALTAKLRKEIRANSADLVAFLRHYELAPDERVRLEDLEIGRV